MPLLADTAAPDRLARQLLGVGVAALGVVGVMGAGLIAYGLTDEAPVVGLVLPLAGLAALAVALVAPSPTATLAAVLTASAVLLSGNKDGISFGEVLFGLGAMGYLAAWVARWAGTGVLRSSTDLAVAAWCVFGIGGGTLAGALYGWEFFGFRADIQAALFLPFYFPVKEVVRRSERGPLLLVGTFLFLGLFATVANAIQLRSSLASATAVYEVVDVRVAGGMMQISAAVVLALAALAVTVGPRAWLVRGAVLGALAALFVGLVLGKSRAYWVATVLGAVVLGALLRGRGDRQRLGLFLCAGVVGVAGVATLVLGDQLALIGAGALDRLTSLGGVSRDISLVNRFVETEAAMDMIRRNPILGYGWGSRPTYYSLVSAATAQPSFVHNGYVALWLKLGVWGLGLMLYAWISTIVRGAWTAWFRPLAMAERALLGGAVGSLVMFSVTALTSNPFSIMDQMLFVALLLGAVNGVAQREPSPPAP